MSLGLTALAMPDSRGPGPEARIPSRFTNSLGMVFVSIPNTMTHLCIWETRVQDFEAFVEAARPPLDKGMYVAVSNTWAFRPDCDWRQPGSPQSPLHPVIGVNWHDARTFCEWLTRHERATGQLSTHQRYRLPTDQEWSATVGLTNEPGATPQERFLGVRDVFPWGTHWPPPAMVGNVASDLALDPYDRTAPVGSFPPNALGCFDLAGNVAEWCDDRWNDEKPFRVLRSAPWNTECRLCLMSAYRFVNLPETRNDYYGFRVALETAAGTEPVEAPPACR